MNTRTGDLRARYVAIGAERMLFGGAAVGVLLGAVLPIVQMQAMLFSAASSLRFYNLGIAGWLLFAGLSFLAGLPFFRPHLSAGRYAIGLLAFAGVVVGILLAMCALSSYSLLSVGAGTAIWLVSALATLLGYSRRISTAPARIEPGSIYGG